MVTEYTSRTVTLSWEPPVSNGGTEITGYIIEKRSSTSTKWSKVVTLDSHHMNYCISNLKEKSEFVFRVFAENSVGLSPPAVTENVILRTHASKFN